MSSQPVVRGGVKHFGKIVWKKFERAELLRQGQLEGPELMTWDLTHLTAWSSLDLGPGSWRT